MASKIRVQQRQRRQYKTVPKREAEPSRNQVAAKGENSATRFAASQLSPDRHSPTPLLQFRRYDQNTSTQPQNLPDRLQQGMEALSGYALDDVKVHYDSPKPAALGAYAYAQGTDIYLGPGQARHLPHETWHVVQQKQGRVGVTRQYNGIPLNENRYLEREADFMGARATRHPASPTAYRQCYDHQPAARAIVQRRAGVEYETQWRVTGDNRTQHKKKIFAGTGWYIESDNNNLEFVLYPPLAKAEDLRDKVAEMGSKATDIKNACNGQDKPLTEAVGNVEPLFTNEQIQPNARDDEMTAKAQFTFGIRLENLEKFFDVLGQADFPSIPYAEANTNFAFTGRTDQSTTRDFLAARVSPSVNESQQYRTDINKSVPGNSAQLRGFLAMVAYYVKSMEATYRDTNEYRAGFLAMSLYPKLLFAQLPVDDITPLLEEILAEGQYPGDIAKAKADLRAASIFGDTVEQDDLNNLRDFLAEQTDFSRHMDYPKYRFILMDRSGFDRMFQSLEQPDQQWFILNKDQVIADLGLQPDEPLFKSPYTYKQKQLGGERLEKGFSFGPTITEWFDSIIASVNNGERDKLSPPVEFLDEQGVQDTDQSMGLLDKVDETQIPDYPRGEGHNVNAALEVIELRQWGDFIKASNWSTHSYDMAVLYSLISGGDLDSDLLRNYYQRIDEFASQRATLAQDVEGKQLITAIEAKIVEIKTKKRKNQAQISKSRKRGRRTHLQNTNKGLNRQIANLQADIDAVLKNRQRRLADHDEQVAKLKKQFGQ